MSDSKTLMANPPLAYNEAAGDLLDSMYLSNVKKRLRQLNQPSKNDMRRWVWELIQNAKDSIANNPERDNVDIRITVDGDKVTFKHNGDPFTPKAQLGLLYKYSQDKDNTQSTGRFGTGFLTTHCLSKVVSIEGDMYKDKTCKETCGFSVTMYRDGLLDSELLDGIKRMKESLKFYEETFGWTTYTYEVKTDTGREALKLGLQNFYDNIAQTMLFCPQLNSVVLDDNGRHVTIERHPVTALADGVKKARFTIHDNGTSIDRSFVFVSSKKYSEQLSGRYKVDRDIRLTMAVEVDDKDNLVAGHESTTHLYCALPLVGTEDQLTEPVFIDCPDFEPDEERQRLLLDGSETTERTVVDKETEETSVEATVSECGINRLIYGNVTDLYDSLVSFLSLKEFGNLYLLAGGLKNVHDYQDLDKGWYVENVTKKYRSVLESYPVVKTCGSPELKKIPDVIFVKEAKEDDTDSETAAEGRLYSLLKSLYPEELIDGEIQKQWSECAWKGLNIWSIKELCEDIAEYKNWNNLKLSGMVLADWYNQFLTLCAEDGLEHLIDYALLPNMYGDLLTSDAEEFYQNRGVSNVVLNIIDGLGYDLRAHLLHSDITAVTLSRECNSTSYSALINRLVKSLIEDESRSGHEKLMVLAPLFSVFQESETWEVNFSNLRRGIWYILGGLYSQTFNTRHILKEDHILKSAWDAADSWVIPYIMEVLENCGNIAGLPSGLPSSWLNTTLDLLSDLSTSFDKYAIVPNQHGEFLCRPELTADHGVPAILKHDILTKIDIDLRAKLLHKSIDASGIGINYGYTAETAAEIINSKMKTLIDQNEQNDEVALFLLSILPMNRKSGLFRQQSLIWHLSTLHFPSECNEVNSRAEIDLGSETLWSTASDQIRDKIVDVITECENLETYNNRMSDMEASVSALNEFYSYLIQVNYGYSNLAIVPNQKGVFMRMSELKADNGKIQDQAKDASELLLEERDHFRTILADSSVIPAPSNVYDLETALGKLDKKVMAEYASQVESPEDDYKNGVSLIVEDLHQEMSGPDFERYFPLIQAKYSDVVLNIVWTAEDRQKIQTIKKKFEKLSPEVQEKILDKGTDVIAEMEMHAMQLQAENARLRQLLETLEGGKTLGVGTEIAEVLSEETMIAANLEAQAAVKARLTELGYVYTQESGDKYYSTIDGVMKDGIEYPLVVKSHKSSDGTFMLSANQWMQLIKPNSILAVHTGGGNVVQVKLQDLLQTQDKLSFSFNIDNLNKADRIDDFAQILHYFTNVQFQFGRLLPSQYKRVSDLDDLRFDARDHSGKPATGNDDML